MIDSFYSAAKTLQRYRSGPLGPYLDGFASVLVERGYTWKTGRRYLVLLRELSEWLEGLGLGVEAVDEPRLAEFLAQAVEGRECIQRGAGSALGLLLRHLRDTGTLPVPVVEVEDTPRRRLEDGFVRYLVEERGLSDSTITGHLSVARAFLAACFGTGPPSVDEVQPEDVTRFILHYTRSGGRKGGGRNAKMIVSGLRAFLRFLHLRGDVAFALTRAVPRMVTRRKAGLPKSLPSEQVRQLLESCDRSRPMGQRDYALLLLLARLGLRAGEVVAMRLEDLDWKAGEILVRGKGQRLERLPLPRDVGEALVAYLRDGRPRCAARQVFVHARAPQRGLADASSVDAIVARSLRRAGLDPPFKGAHLLRHSLATEMLRRGASLGEIGQILRHRQPSTTEIYAKVDIEALRALAQPWPGGAS
jgi:site-specific recombinase XerD